ncbi:hypothetical protein MTZ49_10580 [Entomomonas sp. E2T0]|uniref:hypothetical protein n=1 Tax=Entomomonas sp. E2T0 TaxID=2930213 RepID=UPI0022284D2D|nr:hypothetical protein [Entomomonas sp. E2T0]UYZ83047.1 hypothetical protein MTZ49_10580 [Entomomonas sp. E2T0]
MNNVWKISKKLLTSLTGLCILMLFTAVIVASLGTLLSGGLLQWQTALKTATPYLYLWRLFIYVILASIWYSTFKTYRNKANQAGIEKTKRLGIIAFVVIITVEGSKLWGIINDY